jgi:hypothetical protein
LKWHERKLEHYKERKQENDLHMKTKMPKCMANASFYRIKFRTIDWLTNYLVGGQPLTWWLVIDIVGWLLTLLAGQNIIANIRIRAHSLLESYGQLSQLFNKKH